MIDKIKRFFGYVEFYCLNCGKFIWLSKRSIKEHGPCEDNAFSVGYCPKCGHVVWGEINKKDYGKNKKS